VINRSTPPHPRSHHRQMVDDPEATSTEALHRIPVATIARWWTIQKRHQPKHSTAWPRWLPDVGLDDPEATSTEALHRVASVAT
ncbi:MAG: hypothetical protein ACKN81_09080, partial [Pirellulaceae bacterium]